MRRFNGYMHGIDIGGWLSQCDYSKEHLIRMAKAVIVPKFIA